ncbi:hypothetical protein AB0A95_20555 [Micromonospora sp. NPDC049230]|uniref:hypothetical protein n=1 Tax=Micromonospora sp. NPDC049230 TaxID=3155502 RepID=UPI0034061E5E
MADEAGLAVGSVRHYFTDHEELMIFAVQELGRRVGEWAWAHAERLLGDCGSPGLAGRRGAHRGVGIRARGPPEPAAQEHRQRRHQQ